MTQRKKPRGHRHRNRPMDGNKIRVRGKRLDQVDNTKLALAYWLLAKQLVEDKTDPRQLTEDEVRKYAETIDDTGSPKPPTEERS